MDPPRRSPWNKFGDSRALLSFDGFHSAFYICETTKSTRLLGRSTIRKCLTSYETGTCAWGQWLTLPDASGLRRHEKLMELHQEIL
jgi:hypothetical protein